MTTAIDEGTTSVRQNEGDGNDEAVTDELRERVAENERTIAALNERLASMRDLLEAELDICAKSRHDAIVSDDALLSAMAQFRQRNSAATAQHIGASSNE